MHLASNAKATFETTRLSTATIASVSGDIRGGLLSCSSGSAFTLTTTVINEITVSSASGTVYGGIAYVGSSCTLTESQSSVSGVTTTATSTGSVVGGLAYVLGTASLSSTDVTDFSATSKEGAVSGGILNVASGGTATLSELTISGMLAGSAKGTITGGVVHNSAGTATVDKCTFTSTEVVGGESTISGGILHVGNVSTTSFTGCTASNTTVKSDLGKVDGGLVSFGAVNGGPNSKATISQCSFEDTVVRADKVKGGVFQVTMDSKPTIQGTYVTDTTVSTGTGEINGGILNVAKDAIANLENSTLTRAVVTANQGNIMGGCIAVTQGRLNLVASYISQCKASSVTGRAQGGGAFLALSAIVVMSNASSLSSNTVTNPITQDTIGKKFGGNLLISGAIAVYMLPAPGGRWIAGSLCQVNRKACERSEADLNKYVDDNCKYTEEQCGLLAQSTGSVPCTHSGCSVSNFTCKATLAFQACDWYALPELVGEVVEMLPQGGLDLDYPYICSAGIIGSSDPEYQRTALCAGLSDAGYYQDVAGGTEKKECTKGNYCPAGSSTPIPCPQGTYSSDGQFSEEEIAAGEIKEDTPILLTKASECNTCKKGMECPAGSQTLTACKPGNFNPKAGQMCQPCRKGTFQDEQSATSCKNCTKGYYCTSGSAAALPCPSGKHMNQNLTVMTKKEECITCGPGTFCSVGSESATPCAPGTYNDVAEQGTCKLCPSGKFQDIVGSTTCKQCTAGYYCAEGAASALPCPGGTHANQTALNITGYLMGVNECIICPAGTSCAVGSDKPKDCMPGSFAANANSDSCLLCPGGKYVSKMGQTGCLSCPRGFYCEEGAATPIPCPGGTYSNFTERSSRTTCTQVKLGQWAPLGNALPEPCPTSGFYCPGAANDMVNKVAGSKPIIIPVGDSSISKEVETVQKSVTLDLTCADFDFTAVKESLATQYKVDIALVALDNPCVRRRAEATPAEATLPQLVMPEPTNAVEGSDAMVAVWRAIEQPNDAEPTFEQFPTIEQDFLRGRTLQSGGLTLSMTIATEGTAADGTALSLSAADLTTAIQAVTDADLGSALGTALGTSVTITASTTPTTAMQEMTVKFTCPKGKWCTAGLIVDCTVGTYNPEFGKNLGTACIRCPEFSTSPVASTSITDCVCEPGFQAIPQPDGSVKCECAMGMEIMNGARCDKCPFGTYKTSTGNIKCTDCRSSPIQLAAKENTITAARGAVNASQCVCKAGYYMFEDEVTGQQVCRLCSNLWYQGRVGTDCTYPGVTLATIPVRPGFYRQNPKAEVVRPCINIDAELACKGTVELVVQQTITLETTIDTFSAPGSEDSVKQELATLYKVPIDNVLLDVAAGSVELLFTIKPNSVNPGPPPPPGVAAPPLLTSREGGEWLAEVEANINAIDSGQLASTLSKALAADNLGLVVAPALQVSFCSLSGLRSEDVSAILPALTHPSIDSHPQTSIKKNASDTAPAACAQGYSGPYCAVCDTGYFGGGDGGACMLCSDAGDPSVTIAIQGSVFLLIVTLVTIIMLKCARTCY